VFGVFFFKQKTAYEIRLSLVGSEMCIRDRADVVQLSFDSVGLTPQNIYKVWIDTDSKLVTQWEYYPDESTEALFTTPWDDYRQHGGILLASNRGDYNLENVFTLDSVPGNVFSQPEVSIASLR